MELLLQRQKTSRTASKTRPELLTHTIRLTLNPNSPLCAYVTPDSTYFSCKLRSVENMQVYRQLDVTVFPLFKAKRKRGSREQDAVKEAGKEG